MLHARVALADATHALSLLDKASSVEDFRVLWVAELALLRTIGHVLHKVDRDRTKLRDAIDCAWSRWNSDRAAYQLFWVFIEEERNVILKQYEHRWFEGPVLLEVGSEVLPIGEYSTRRLRKAHLKERMLAMLWQQRLSGGIMRCT